MRQREASHRGGRGLARVLAAVLLMLLGAGRAPAQLGGVEMGGKGGGLPGGGPGDEPGNPGDATGGRGLVGQALGRHILARITYGANDRELGLLRNLGADGYIRYQLEPDRIAESQVLTDALGSLPEPYTAVGDPMLDSNSLYADYYLRATYSYRQLQEVMTEFWRNHFNTGLPPASGGFTGFFSSLAFDPVTGFPFIAYYDANYDRPRVASWNGNQWTQMNADSQRGNGWYTSLAIDPSSGLPAVCYRSTRDDTLRLSRFDGTDWNVETVDANLGTGHWSSLAFDVQGRAHIAYYDATGQDLMLARWDDAGGLWEMENVDVDGDVGSFASLALDTSGRPHIAYYDQTNGDLKYAFKDAAVWSLDVVDATGNVGAWCSLALDPGTELPAIAYHDVDAGALKVARRDAGGWLAPEEVDAAGNVGQHTSIAFEQTERLAVAYQDADNYDLKLARWDPVGGAWNLQTVRDNQRITGEWSSLGFYTDGGSGLKYPAISYYNGSFFYLRFALWSGTDWSVSTADSRGTTQFRYAVWNMEETDGYRQQALGKFRDLLQVSSTSAAMMLYLNNNENLAGNGNENYARELLELHTMGVDGGYSQTDVEEAARALTGWGIKPTSPRCDFELPADPPREFCYNHAAHDGFEKTVLGVTFGSPTGVQTPEEGMAEGEALLDLLAAHPATARFICKKLVQKFVADEPPPRIWQQCMRSFRSSGGDIKRVLTEILFSDEFRDPANYMNKVRTPIEYSVAPLRQLRGVTDGVTLWYLTAVQGMEIFRYDIPTGYSEAGEDWVSSNSFLQRWKYADLLAHAAVPGVLAVYPYDQVFIAGLSRPEDVVNYFLGRMVRGQAGDTERQLLLHTLEPGLGNPPFDINNRQVAEPRIRELVGMVIGFPAYMKQ